MSTEAMMASGVMVLCELAILTAVSVWVYGDAKKRGFGGGRAMFWAMTSWLFLILVLPLWLLTRPPVPAGVQAVKIVGKVALCPECGKYYENPCAYCPNCGKPIGGVR